MASDVDVLERIGTEGRQVRYEEARPALGRRPTRTGPVVLDSLLSLTTWSPDHDQPLGPT